ncbi:MAG TPA: cupin domain-containing protein [Actinomycetota bacterium]|nr:cupin domain-containing protein [Actinomycetota bacterium]
MDDAGLRTHSVRRASEASFAVPGAFVDHSAGFRRWAAVDRAAGAVHTGFGICELDPGGAVEGHVHSFEESFYVLEGEVVAETNEGTFLLRPGDYGFVPVGSPHAWRNVGSERARWADMLSPQPDADLGPGTFFAPMDRPDRSPSPIDVRDPRTRSFGHIEPETMEVSRQTQDMLAVSASMRTALLVYSGITVKMMVDSDLGSYLSTMFMVAYEPGGVAGVHDHPFEETYLILHDEVDAVFDEREYRLSVGDVAFAGVGCPHAFNYPGTTTVRWLETQAPQPPARHSYRFARDWDYLRDHL